MNFSLCSLALVVSFFFLFFFFCLTLFQYKRNIGQSQANFRIIFRFFFYYFFVCLLFVESFSRKINHFNYLICFSFWHHEYHLEFKFICLFSVCTMRFICRNGFYAVEIRSEFDLNGQNGCGFFFLCIYFSRFTNFIVWLNFYF